MKLLVGLCALNLAVAVGLGAFGAHALADHLTARALETYRTGVLYHQVHGVGALVASLASPKIGSLPAWLILVGTWIFSFSLVLLAVTGTRWLGAITPLGGVGLISGYLALAWKGARLAT